MDHRIAPARPLGRALTATLAAFGLAVAAFAVAPSSALAQPKKAAQKPAPKSAPAKPAPKAEANQKPQFIYSPWTKVCQKGPETNNKQVCFVHADGRIETGQPVVIVQLIEPEGEPKRLQVILPIAVLVQNGTRILVDNTELGKAPFAVCVPQAGCSAFYSVDDSVIAKLKKGKTMDVQTFNPAKRIVSLPLPLTNFAKAYDGPPIDPKQLETQQRKLQSELQKKAEEARKRLEAQQPNGQKK